MSILIRKRLIGVGDTVFMWGGREDILSVKMQRDSTIQNKRGQFFHNDIIGQPYGSKFWSKGKKGWFFGLNPTPELWLKAMRHRTQILYHADISTICQRLELRPGNVVLESGTGSGALSTAMARCIAPNGKLLTFEFNKNRVDAAKEDFAKNKLDHIIDVTWRDTCNDGFRLNNVADSVFLDLPSPWDVIKSAWNALIEGGRVCSFSPCIEQVQRTCEELVNHGFIGIETIECLIRPHDIVSNTLMAFDFTEQLGMTSKEVSDLAFKGKKRARTENEEEKGEAEAESENKEGESKEEVSEEKSNLLGAPAAPRILTTDRRVVATKPTTNIAGHTGFLTFAVKPFSTNLPVVNAAPVVKAAEEEPSDVL